MHGATLKIIGSVLPIVVPDFLHHTLRVHFKLCECKFQITQTENYLHGIIPIDLVINPPFFKKISLSEVLQKELNSHIETVSIRHTLVQGLYLCHTQ
jgi:hypothetical protein